MVFKIGYSGCMGGVIVPRWTLFVFVPRWTPWCWRCEGYGCVDDRILRIEFIIEA